MFLDGAGASRADVTDVAHCHGRPTASPVGDCHSSLLAETSVDPVRPSVGDYKRSICIASGPYGDVSTVAVKGVIVPYMWLPTGYQNGRLSCLSCAGKENASEEKSKDDKEFGYEVGFVLGGHNGRYNNPADGWLGGSIPIAFSAK